MTGTDLTRYVRAPRVAHATFRQPLPDGDELLIVGLLLGEMHLDGKLDHYRVEANEGVIHRAPPEWLSPASRRAILRAGLTLLPEEDAQ